MKTVAILLVCTVFGTVPARAASKEETAAVLRASQLQVELTATQAELLATRAQLAAVTKTGVRTAAANGVAIERHAADAAEAVVSVRDAAHQIVDTAESTNLELVRLRATMPINSVPVWLAAIAALVSLLGIVSTIVLALINKGKLAEIHVLTNGNLAKMATELQVANERNAGLRESLSYANKEVPAPSNKTP